MDNENEFNFSNDNTFRKSSYKHSSPGFGKTIFLPFISGVVGATLVVGTCFSVPSIKNKIVGNQSYRSTLPSAGTTVDSPLDLINISEYSNTSIAVAKKVLPSVVGITVNYKVSSIFGSSTGEGSGSGIIISEDGYILTNNHVISSESSSYYSISEATGITVNLYNDDETYEAKVIGTDAYTDLAVLKIEKTGLTPATLGNSDTVEVGEFTMAIGNPLGMDYSVTTGVVSAVNREVQSDGTTYVAIQTDAAINSGNSGGALVNANGEVIGINTLKLSGSGIEGIGFAIPISSTTSIIDQLIEHSTVKRPYIGISGSEIDERLSTRYGIPQGVYIEEVEAGSPAEKAGLKTSDIITKIEGKEVKSVNELNRIKYTYNIGDKVKLTIVRDHNEQEFEIELVETPEQTESQTQTQQNTYIQGQDIPDSIFDLFR